MILHSYMARRFAMSFLLITGVLFKIRQQPQHRITRRIRKPIVHH